MRVAIVDDEALARARLSRLLMALENMDVVASCESAEALLKVLDEQPLDALWLDIQMPGLDGMELAALLRDRQLPVVFVSAHGDRALDAFAVEAVDFLLKPVDPNRVREAAARLLRLSRGKTRVLPIETASGVVLVQPEQITHASFDGQLVSVHLTAAANPRQLDTTWSLNGLLTRLPVGLLERVHRRHVLNLDHVERLSRTPAGGYVAWVRGGGQVEVSRQAGRKLRRRLGW